MSNPFGHPPSSGHTFQDQDNRGNARVHNGNVNLYISRFSSHNNQAIPAPPSYRLGLSLGGAPQVDDDIFVGRETELEQLKEWLAHTPLRQNIVAISGLGGIGKTHLSIHFAKLFHNRYSSIIWLNAKDVNTLKTGLLALALRILGEREHEVVLNQLDKDQAVQYVRQWLSEPENKEWLVIYDNYDDPQLPGILSSTGYDIRQFFPHRAQGSILITTRSSRIKFGKQVWLCKLKDLHQSLTLLANRSGRETKNDINAHKLAKRLDGLPLALATAGTHISQTADSFADYLQMYEESWNDLAENSDELFEYGDRTLYSTWNLSLKQVKAQDPEAAEILRLMAYFGNTDLWYELFQKRAESGPMWLLNIVKSKARFNKAMGKLQEYSLVETRVEARSGRYSLHTCVHDWTLEYLNREIDTELYHLAAHCIARNVKEDTEAEFWVANRDLVQHVSRLESGQLKSSIDWSSVELEDIYMIAYLNNNVGRIAEAEAMYKQALEGKEKAWGSEHTSTLDIVNDLGSLFANQGKMAEAEAMYKRALEGYEKAWGIEHLSTLNTVNNLGNLCRDQEKMVEAEAMYKRALEGYEKAWGVEHPSTLNTVNNLGNLYTDQGKMAEAEAMYKRALEGKEKAWGSEHTSTLDTVNNLGLLYANQGKMAEAEAMYKRALEGKEKAWGPEHTSTLDTVNNLGLLYVDQGKMAEAEAMYKRALEGYKKAWGPEHRSTLDIVNNLGSLYTNQGKIAKAEAMYKRALEGKEKARGPEHTSTLDTVNNLGLLYKYQGKMAEAEAMYKRALEGYKKAWGVEHPSALTTVNNLGLLYADQGRLVQAEEMCRLTLKGRLKIFGRQHSSTLWAVNALQKVLLKNCRENALQTKDTSNTILASSSTMDLIYLSQEWGTLRPNIFGALGRALICSSDDFNAGIAFAQEIFLEENNWIYGCICDGCGRALTVVTGRFVCKSCEDVDVCKDCFNRKKEWRQIIPSCVGHSFLEVTPSLLSDPEAGVMIGNNQLSKSTQSWFESMKMKYQPASHKADEEHPELLPSTYKNVG